jgi:hypothetical protein
MNYGYSEYTVDGNIKTWTSNRTVLCESAINFSGRIWEEQSKYTYAINFISNCA